MITANVQYLKDGQPHTDTVVFPGVLPRPGDDFVLHGDTMIYHYRVKHVKWHCYANPHGPDRAEATVDVDQCYHREARA